MKKLSENDINWVRDNYKRLGQMTEEEKNLFLQKAGEIRKKRDGNVLFENDIKDQFGLAKVLGFAMPGEGRTDESK